MRSYTYIAFFIFLVSLTMSMLSNLGFMNIVYNPNSAWIGEVQNTTEIPSGTTSQMTTLGWIGGVLAAFNILMNTIWQSTFGLYTLLLQLGVPSEIAIVFYLVNLFSFMVLLVEFFRGMKL